MIVGMNPHNHLIRQGKSPKDLWQCYYCKQSGTYDEMETKECSYAYPPCKYCGQTPLCAPDCKGMIALLGQPEIRVISDELEPPTLNRNPYTPKYRIRKNINGIPATFVDAMGWLVAHPSAELDTKRGPSNEVIAHLKLFSWSSSLTADCPPGADWFALREDAVLRLIQIAAVHFQPKRGLRRRNPDDRFRRRERDARSGGQENRARFLQERLRAGEITRDQLWVAAILGDEAAYSLILPPERSRVDPDIKREEWFRFTPAKQFKELVEGYQHLSHPIAPKELIFRRAMDSIRQQLVSVLRTEARHLENEAVSDQLIHFINRRAVALSGLSFTGFDVLPLNQIARILTAAHALSQPDGILSDKIRRHRLHRTFLAVQRVAIDAVYTTP